MNQTNTGPDEMASGQFIPLDFDYPFPFNIGDCRLIRMVHRNVIPCDGYSVS